MVYLCHECDRFWSDEHRLQCHNVGPAYIDSWTDRIHKRLKIDLKAKQSDFNHSNYELYTGALTSKINSSHFCPTYVSRRNTGVKNKIWTRSINLGWFRNTFSFSLPSARFLSPKSVLFVKINIFTEGIGRGICFRREIIQTGSNWTFPSSFISLLQ